MSTRLFRNALSMESAEAKPEEKLIDPTESQLALESATVEINDAGFEVQMAELQQEELEHAYASLESIATSLEGLVESDPRGLDRVSAEGYHHAVGAILGDSLPNPVASMESFGGETECAEATQLSMESLKDTLQKIWAGIKRSIENAIRAASDFFAKLFGGVAKLQDRIKSMQQEVAKAKSDGLKASGKFKVPGANAIQMGGKVDQRTIEQGAAVVMSNVAGGADALQAAAVDYYEGLRSFYQKPSEDAGDLEKEHKAAKDKIAKIKIMTGELPGGKAFEVNAKTDGDLETVGVPKLVDAPNKKDVSGDVEIDVLDLGTIEKLLGEAAKFADEMAKKKSRREQLKKARMDTVKAAEDFVGKADNLSDKAKQFWSQTKLNWALKSANMDFTSTIARVDGYVFSYVRALLAVLGAALGKYGEQSSEEQSQEEMSQEEAGEGSQDGGADEGESKPQDGQEEGAGEGGEEEEGASDEGKK